MFDAAIDLDFRLDYVGMWCIELVEFGLLNVCCIVPESVEAKIWASLANESHAHARIAEELEQLARSGSAARQIEAAFRLGPV